MSNGMGPEHVTATYKPGGTGSGGTGVGVGVGSDWCKPNPVAKPLSALFGWAKTGLAANAGAPVTPNAVSISRTGASTALVKSCIALSFMVTP
jgi:hypothetical protein